MAPPSTSAHYPPTRRQHVTARRDRQLRSTDRRRPGTTVVARRQRRSTHHRRPGATANARRQRRRTQSPTAPSPTPQHPSPTPWHYRHRPAPGANAAVPQSPHGATDNSAAPLANGPRIAMNAVRRPVSKMPPRAEVGHMGVISAERRRARRQGRQHFIARSPNCGPRCRHHEKASPPRAGRVTTRHAASPGARHVTTGEARPSEENRPPRARRGHDERVTTSTPHRPDHAASIITSSRLTQTTPHRCQHSAAPGAHRTITSTLRHDQHAAPEHAGSPPSTPSHLEHAASPPHPEHAASPPTRHLTEARRITASRPPSGHAASPPAPHPSRARRITTDTPHHPEPLRTGPLTASTADPRTARRRPQKRATPRESKLTWGGLLRG